MVKLFISNNRSSRTAKKFLKTHEIPFVEISLNSKITKKDLLFILSKSENGVDDILSQKNPDIKAFKQFYEQLTLNNVIEYLLNNKKLLKTPIIIDDRHFLCGYNNEDIRMFLRK